MSAIPIRIDPLEEGIPPKLALAHQLVEEHPNELKLELITLPDGQAHHNVVVLARTPADREAYRAYVEHLMAKLG